MTSSAFVPVDGFESSENHQQLSTMNIKHGQDGHDANELNDHEKGGGTYALMRDCNASVRQVSPLQQKI